MININRPIEPPPSLRKEPCVTTVRTLLDRYGAGGKPTKDEIPAHWTKKDVRDELYRMQDGKCAYCERLRNEFRETDIDHYRPKGAVEGVPEHPGYWWLAYEWKNLLGTCKQCNQDFKRAAFPLKSTGTRACKHDDDLVAEQPLLIDPTESAWINCIGWDARRLPGDGRYMVYAYARPRHPSAERAEHTIRQFGLNEGKLPLERGEKYLLFRNVIDAYLRARDAEFHLEDRPQTNRLRRLIEDELHSCRPFLGFRRWLLDQFEEDLL